MKKSLKYIEENKDKFVDELFELLRIPSISANKSYKEDVLKAAKWVKNQLTAIGMDKVELHPTPGHPIVFGEKIINKSFPTILIYGHYDVQPPDPLHLWNSKPFEPMLKDGKIYARGAADDKGQFFMHLKSVEAMIETGELNCNVKFLIEGEEEVGSDNLDAFVLKNKELLKCDTILISDTSMLSENVPSITTGLKGLSYMEVEVTGPNRDLHSGTYGGAVGNPINTLCDLISSLKDQDGKITIPGFYDDVEVISSEERAEIALAPFDDEEYKRALDINATFGEKGYSTLERTGIRPTLDVNGIWGGYIEEGAKTVLPSKAYAKISMRLVPNQTSDKITALFKSHFESIAPDCVKVKVTPHHGGNPASTNIFSKDYLAASKAMEKSFGKKPIPVKAGGSIPIVSFFQKELDVEVILLGFGLDSDAIHSPNESFRLANFYKGIETIPWFFHYYKNEE